jgi:hypothetical protein
LRRFGLRDRALDWNTSRAGAVRFLVRELPLALVLVPIAALALTAFAVPYMLTALAGRMQKHSDVTATAKVIAGSVFYLAWIAALAAGPGSLFGTAAALATAVLLPALGMAGVFASEREIAAWRTTRSWLALRGTHPNTRQRLRRHRAELADVLDDVGRGFRPGRNPPTP